MQKIKSPFPSHNTRIGLHYFPDTLHYRESDLQTWLPRLQSMAVSWLVLLSPSDRAIPEHFIRGLSQAGIEPIIQFETQPGAWLKPEEIQTLLAAYRRWGVHSTLFYERPNSRRSWPSPDWAQKGLVDRFLEQYLPLARLALAEGLNPILPLLEPGGSYWDTTFLRAMLESLLRRKENALLENLVLSAYAWSWERPLNWGAGGPERWPDARPYHTSPETQDQRGFRAYDWYQAIVKALLGKPLPVVLFQAGISGDPLNQSPQQDTTVNGKTILAIARLLEGEDLNDPSDPSSHLDAIPEEVVACNFWLLATDTYSPFQNQAWFQQDGGCIPLVEDWIHWAGEKCQQKTAPIVNDLLEDIEPLVAPPVGPSENGYPIAHYLLLPTYEWGIADWHLEVIRPFVKKYQPTIGFSVSEASMAARVTVVGNEQVFPDSLIARFRMGGAIVERVSGSGTSIATQLAER